MCTRGQGRCDSRNAEGEEEREREREYSDKQMDSYTRLQCMPDRNVWIHLLCVFGCDGGRGGYRRRAGGRYAQLSMSESRIMPIVAADVWPWSSGGRG